MKRGKEQKVHKATDMHAREWINTCITMLCAAFDKGKVHGPGKLLSLQKHPQHYIICQISLTRLNLQGVHLFSSFVFFVLFYLLL